jgi:SAM-dependent methyltransferase
MTSNVRVSVDVSLTPTKAFDTLADELILSLETRGLKIDNLSEGGRVMEGNAEVGTVREWTRGKKISLLWNPKTWEKGVTSKVLLTFKAKTGGTTITLQHQDWGAVLGNDKEELLGWFAGEVVAPLLSSFAPNRLGDWITDRNARRPSGPKSRDVYKNPIYHWPNFLAILDLLALSPADRLLEVGCGGGAFLHEALKSGCRASAIDHSLDMVRLAIQVNRDSITEGRLKISAGEADSLPYPDGTFTWAVMTGVLGFLPDALQAFKEVFRVLERGGRFVAYTGTKKMKGTPAAPEPAASRLHFYEDDELESIARRAGFSTIKVEHPSLFEYAKKAGVPREGIELFRGTESQLLIANKA